MQLSCIGEAQAKYLASNDTWDVSRAENRSFKISQVPKPRAGEAAGTAAADTDALTCQANEELVRETGSRSVRGWPLFDVRSVRFGGGGWVLDAHPTVMNSSMCGLRGVVAVITVLSFMVRLDTRRCFLSLCDGLAELSLVPLLVACICVLIMLIPWRSESQKPAPQHCTVYALIRTDPGLD